MATRAFDTTGLSRMTFATRSAVFSRKQMFMIAVKIIIFACRSPEQLFGLTTSDHGQRNPQTNHKAAGFRKSRCDNEHAHQGVICKYRIDPIQAFYLEFSLFAFAYILAGTHSADRLAIGVENNLPALFQILDPPIRQQQPVFDGVIMRLIELLVEGLIESFVYSLAICRVN